MESKSTLRSTVPSDSSLIDKEALQSPQQGVEANVEPKSNAPPPKTSTQGDLKAWLQVVGAFFVFFNTWGLLLAFGAFQAYYERTLLADHSSSAISWIATTNGFLLLVGGMLTGPIFDYGYVRYLVVVGSFLVVFGTMMTSLATQYYQFLLAQGICVGLGSGMLWVPCMSVVASKFGPSQRAFAMGIATSGSSIGGVIYPIMFEQLRPRVGFGWAVRIMGFVALLASIITIAVMVPHAPPRSKTIRRLIDRSAFTDLPYMALTVSGFFSLIGYYAPLVYLPTYVETAIDDLTTPSLAFYVLAIINGSSTFSRISAGWLASKFGAIHIYVASIIASAVLLFTWPAVHTTAGLIVWTVLWGLITGLIISLPGAIIPSLCPSMDVIGTRMGMVWSGASLGLLVGSPIAGALVVYTPDGGVIWWHLQVFAGISMLVGWCLTLVPWFHLLRQRR